MFFCGSFSTPTKTEIKRRARQHSELSGENSRPLCCAHLRHQAGKPPSWYFETPANGRLVTDIEHWAHHFLFYPIPRIIGLSKKQNLKTIVTLYSQVQEYNEGNNISYKLFEEKYESAKRNWIMLYDENPKTLGLSTKKKDEIVKNLIYTSEQYPLDKAEEQLQTLLTLLPSESSL